MSIMLYSGQVGGFSCQGGVCVAGWGEEEVRSYSEELIGKFTQ